MWSNVVVCFLFYLIILILLNLNLNFRGYTYPTVVIRIIRRGFGLFVELESIAGTTGGRRNLLESLQMMHQPPQSPDPH